jgi:Peptidase family M28
MNMKKIFFTIFMVANCLNIFAQKIIERDVSIENMVAQVNADSLKNYIKNMVSFGTRHTLSEQSSKTRGIAAARNYVFNEFNRFALQSKSKFEVYLDTTTLQPNGKRIDTPTLLGNVVGVLKGTNAADNRFFVISGHLDSRRSKEMDRTGDSPGANDDGSGVAAVMECARIISKQTFGATIVFVAFSGEEQGLLGARFMAETAVKNKVNIEAILNNDIMGSNNSNQTNIINNTQVRVFSEGLPYFELDKNANNIRNLGLENDGKARQLARYFKEVGERYVDHLEIKLIYRNDRFLRGGDHTAFVEKGFTAVRITEMNENFNRQHQDVRVENGIQYGDLLEFVDGEYLRKNTAANLATLANLASAPKMPQEVKIEVAKLTNYTELYWKKNEDNCKGYYVLVRETDSPTWQKKIFTKENKIQLPYSKDNYFFAVQAISQNGNESLPVIPTVAR